MRFTKFKILTPETARKQIRDLGFCLEKIGFQQIKKRKGGESNW